MTTSSKVDTLLQSPITVSQSFVAFANQRVGTTSPAQNVTLTNVSAMSVNLTGFTFTGPAPSNYSQTSTCGTSLAAGQSCTISITFAPKDFGVLWALLNVSIGGPSTPLLISLSGFGSSAVATLSPSSLSFPTEPVQRTGPIQKVTLTNTGSLPLSITGFSISGDFTAQNNCPSSLRIGASCNISVAFKPTAIGVRTGAVTISDNAPHSPQTLALSGTGTFALTSPTSINFGIVKVGQSSTQPVTLTNLGNTTMTIHNIYTSGPPFTETNTCGTSLASRASCTISVTFTHTRAITKVGTLFISDSGGGSPQTVSLTGTGQ